VAWWQRWVDRWLSAGVRSSASTPSPFKMGAAEVGSVNQKKEKKEKDFLSKSSKFNKNQWMYVLFIGSSMLV
jgi:hypothetical protein